MKLNKLITAAVSVALLLGIGLQPLAASSETAAPAGDKNTVTIGSQNMSYRDYLLGIDEQNFTGETVTVDGTDYKSGSDVSVVDLPDNKGEALRTEETATVTWAFSIEKSGMYAFRVTYYTEGGNGSEIQRNIKIDGKNTVAELESIGFRRVFEDTSPIERVEDGNDVRAEHTEIRRSVSENIADSDGFFGSALYFYFESGEHTLTMSGIQEPMTVEKIEVFSTREELKDYSEYLKDTDSEPVNGELEGGLVIYEAENMSEKSDSGIYGTSDITSPENSPYDYAFQKLNVIGGSKWQSVGQRVTYEIEVPADGYYNLTGVSADAAFNPTKLSVDDSGRIYVVARNYNLGILQLDKKGGFVGYIGAPKVQYNFVQMLWRKISTEEQLAKMEQYVPTEYNNIAIDSEGFVYGTIGTLDAEKLEATINSGDTSGTVTPIKKLNTTGSDVLKRNGSSAPLGDLEYDEEFSKIVDVAYTDSGVYAMLDSQHGHIFLYDDNGNLLTVFGGNGTDSGFSQVSSFTFSGEDIAVLDAQSAKLFVFELTVYGSTVMSAVSAQYNGDFEKAYTLWSDVAAYNRNFEYAFVGLGQAYKNDGEYEKAMECFQYANDKKNYSEAKSLLRKESMKTVFPVIFISILCIAGAAAVFSAVKKIYLYVKGVNRPFER